MSSAAPKSPPGPRGHRLIGSLLDVRRDRIRFITKATAEYGDIVEFRMGPKRLFLLSHPDHAKHVLATNHRNYRKGLGLSDAMPFFGRGLLTAEGSQWSADRALLQSAFHPDYLPSYASRTVKAAVELRERWNQQERSGFNIDVSREMARLTLNILTDTLLRTNLTLNANALLDDMEVVSTWAMKRMASVVKLPLYLPTLGNLRVRRALRDLKSVADAMIRTHRSIQGIGILDLLMPNGPQSLDPHDLKRVRDHILTFLLAGHETTASTLAWTWYLLSRHPEVEAKLIEELELELQGTLPCYDDLPRLSYTRSVIQEVVRLYPPVWMLSRIAISNDRINGFSIPAGADVLVSVYSIHRHPDYWRDPNQFSPMRFAAGEPTVSGYSFLPFGAGPRSCIGANLGLVESMLIVATLLQKYRIQMSSDRDVQPQALLTLHPAGRLIARPVSRKSASNLTSGVVN